MTWIGLFLPVESISMSTARGILRVGRIIGRRNFTLVEAFETIALNRHAERNFSKDPVAACTIQRIVELTLTAPTSFNLQPYKVIIIQSKACKDLVATAMNPGNDRHVINAAYSIIFAADCDPARNTRKLIDLETSFGANPSYISSLPAKISLLVGKGVISNRLRAIGSHLMSPLSPSPVIRSSNEAWGMKNASFAAMQLMMASTAFGLRTLPMEGFDERRLRAVLAIPEEYSIPVVVSVGHSADVNDVLPKLAAGVVADNSASTRTEDSNDSAVDAETAPRASPNLKVRFPLHDMCYVDQFGNPAKFNW